MQAKKGMVTHVGWMRGMSVMHNPPQAMATGHTARGGARLKETKTKDSTSKSPIIPWSK